MKKKILSVLLAATLVVSLFAGCGKSKKDNIIKVGASPTPHAEILKVIEDKLKDKGYTLEIVEYNDYILPNNATENGELDANYFQHQPYLENFNEKTVHILYLLRQYILNHSEFMPERQMILRISKKVLL